MCLSVCEHSIFTKFFVHVTYGHFIYPTETQKGCVLKVTLPVAAPGTQFAVYDCLVANVLAVGILNKFTRCIRQSPAVVYWGVYAGIRRIPTSRFFRQRILTSVIINKQGTFRPSATPLCVYPPPFLAIHHWRKRYGNRSFAVQGTQV